MFREERAAGILMKAEPDERTRFKYTIWFDYTRDLINKVTDGDFAVVQNYSSDKDVINYNVLEIINVLPFHYAIGTDLKGYPGFTKEAAKSASFDWVEQETDSTEDTTKIICEAIPTNFEFKDESSIEKIEFKSESTMAMVGTEVKLLNTELTKKIVNMGINEKIENVFSVGTLLRNGKIDINIRIEDLIKTHFGIFGFTGVGKSNLTSTVISGILEKSKENVKVVLFDLMDEYTGLLIDQLSNPKIDAKIICIGNKTLPGPTFHYINKDEGSTLDDATEAFLDNLLLPKGLKNRLDDFTNPISSLLTQNKIKILDLFQMQTVEQFLRDRESKLKHEKDGAPTETQMKKIMAIFETHKSKILNKNTVNILIQPLQGLESSTTNVAKGRLEFLIEELKTVANAGEAKPLPDEIKISLKDIIEDLNNKKTKSLFIITSHDPNELRNLTKMLGNRLYELRRERGFTTPLISFICDEADEFIPGEAKGSSYYASKEIIEKLARRGRKFGIGIGIVTQRIVYLDTNIMGQPHTYFISKLPRKSDRERIAEAFSISEDLFTQTFKFQKGNWLLISHDATGMDSVPISIKTRNAEERIKEFFDKFKA
jgi:hypothetical protein